MRIDAFETPPSEYKAVSAPTISGLSALNGEKWEDFDNFKRQKICTDKIPIHKQPALNNLTKLTADEVRELAKCVHEKHDYYQNLAANGPWKNRRNRKQTERWARAWRMILQDFNRRSQEHLSRIATGAVNPQYLDVVSPAPPTLLDPANDSTLDTTGNGGFGPTQAGFGNFLKNIDWTSPTTLIVAGVLGVGAALAVANLTESTKTKKKPARSATPKMTGTAGRKTKKTNTKSRSRQVAVLTV